MKTATTATFLAHATHAAKDRTDRTCVICADRGAVRITWADFAATWADPITAK